MATLTDLTITNLEFLVPKPQTRCGHSECKKKLTLTDNDCRCGIRFCMNHRHAETHGCTFDYRAAAQALLVANNAQCVASKLNKM